MKNLALLLSLVLSTCVTAPTVAHLADLSPVKWYAVYVWTHGNGTEYIDPPSVKRNMPRTFDTRKTCESLGGMSVNRLNHQYGGWGKPAVRMVCIAARHKLQLRNHLRSLDLNFGGRPA